MIVATFSSRTQTTLGLFFFSCSLLGCGRGPESIVGKAFDAFHENDSNGVNDVMSQQGLANAALYCGGAAINCLGQNYAGRGDTNGVSTELRSQLDTSAEVELRTTWSAIQGEYCQTYKLDKTDAGWRISFFDVPSLCTSPP
jgi:hypothetical protein